MFVQDAKPDWTPDMDAVRLLMQNSFRTVFITSGPRSLRPVRGLVDDRVVD